MSNQLTGKTALVTGGSSGIGKAIAIAYGLQGANVVINYRSGEAGANEAVHVIQQQGGQAIAVQADVSKEEEVLRLFKQTIEHFKTLDLLVCNAGIQKDNQLSEMSLEEWQKVIDVNLTGYFLCAREAIKHFVQNKHGAGKTAIGNIIFVSSVHDIIPWAGHVNYAASKGGVLMLMKSLALEVAPKKIRVNGISPGAIKTDINKDVWQDEEKAKKLLELIPYQRIGDPEDVAEVATWLATDASDYITGTTIYVDGGMTLYPGFVDNG
jgi:glucose 1-dehydrogenase